MKLFTLALRCPPYRRRTKLFSGLCDLVMELKRPALAARVADLIRRQEVRFLCLTLKS
jgi:hypothetical protein